MYDPDKPGLIQPTNSVGPADRRALGDRLGPAVTFATTEHFNLQTARAGTISEAMATLSVQHRHHRRARDAYRPDAIDRAAIFVPEEAYAA